MKKDKILMYVVHIFLISFLIIYSTIRNFEFVGYAAITLVLFWFMMYVYKKYELPFILLLGFVGWIFLHMLGGMDINGLRVYGMMLIDIVGAPLFILRYDQVVHLYCYIVIGAIVFYVAKKHVKKMDGIMLFIIIIASTGIGALNEIVEFMMVLVLGTTGVGDYYNTSLDLVFNFFGSIIGVLTADYYSRR